jgi:hypothetical protein
MVKFVSPAEMGKSMMPLTDVIALQEPILLEASVPLSLVPNAKEFLILNGMEINVSAYQDILLRVKTVFARV